MSLRYFVILAPAATATLVSIMGLAPNYLSLAFILLLTGVSIAAFHAPAPAMIGRISGKQVGKGMSYFMASGELARTIGPLVAVWAVSLWTLDGVSHRLVWVGLDDLADPLLAAKSNPGAHGERRQPAQGIATHAAAFCPDYRIYPCP